MARLEPAEAGIMGLLLDQLEQLLEADADDVRGDPVMTRLLPDGHRGDPEVAADYRELTEASLRSDKADDLALMRATIPAEGGEVRLDADQGAAWLRSTNDLRLALGTRLEISDDTEPRRRSPTRRTSSSPSTTGSRRCRAHSSTHWSPDAPAEAEHDQQRQQHVEAEEHVDHPVQLDVDDGRADRGYQDHRRQGEDHEQHQRPQGHEKRVGHPVGRFVHAVAGTPLQPPHAQDQGGHGEEEHPEGHQKLHQHVPQRIACIHRPVARPCTVGPTTEGAAPGCID
ncbi:DUF2017 family protein [Blastococcus brunescens]|uniref:DUF2017 family protein n=1 Tax=Blastococcus brunescens TaxID=1564165 RepID=A0ABZ1B816_9ACTN|nr:DUF2017 family protein [Blastococcus sp. BMG 8361]WRL65185.1 DUF2017 family protein [Blastococcus sp. BMG 8361]